MRRGHRPPRESPCQTKWENAFFTICGNKELHDSFDVLDWLLKTKRVSV
jgi:hypothetical protein